MKDIVLLMQFEVKTLSTKVDCDREYFVSGIIKEMSKEEMNKE